MGDLLQNIEMPGIGNVYSRLCWGRGLNTIVQTAREAVNQIALDNFYAGYPGRKILILVGWSGNDVHGDFGYQGCTWTHQSRYLKSDADRKVAAEWPSKQKARVDKAIHDLVDLKADDNVYDVVVWERTPPRVWAPTIIQQSIRRAFSGACEPWSECCIVRACRNEGF